MSRDKHITQRPQLQHLRVVTTAAAALLLIGGADAALLAARWIRDADFVHGPAVFDPDPGMRVHDGLLRS